jgi:enamine deaminase RidA (YjgF/YER057c/UK114 family)
MADTNRLQAATQKTLEKLLAALDHLGLNKTDIVQLKAFIQPMSEVGTVRQEITNFFTGKAPPTVFVEWISPSPNPPIEIELIARGRKDQSQERNALSFPDPTRHDLHESVQPSRSRGSRETGLCFGGLRQPTGRSAEVREIFGSLGSVLRKAGSDFDHLAKATYYVTDERSEQPVEPDSAGVLPTAASAGGVESEGAGSRPGGWNGYPGHDCRGALTAVRRSAAGDHLPVKPLR